jgi:hypothetical protein
LDAFCINNTHTSTSKQPTHHPTPLLKNILPALAAQVRENFKALDVVPKLTPDVCARIDAVIAAAAAPSAASEAE